MTTSLPSLSTLAAGLLALTLPVAMPRAASAVLDGSAPFLCAINTIMECDDTGTCQRHTTQQHPDFPSFLRVNVREGMITGGDNSGRKTEIKSSTRLDGRLILHGGENGRGWSATIAEDTGRMTAGVVAADFTFALFGACTVPSVASANPGARAVSAGLSRLPGPHGTSLRGMLATGPSMLPSRNADRTARPPGGHGAPLPTMAPAADATGTRVMAGARERGGPMDEPIVYVVDDDESVCRALARLFRTVGLSVETFPSAKAFLEHSPGDRPACLILDVRLPGPSGLELQDVLSQARPDLPIVFITGHGDVPSTVRAMKGGAVDFLQKPFNDQELLDCVERALARSRQQRVERAERDAVQADLDTLTPREREVLLQVVTGKLNKQIASDLGIAEKTIKVHRGRVMQKMRANSVADLVRMVEKVGLSAP